MLACQAGVPVVAISHNSGNCWPARSWIRLPGTITLRISPPIHSDGKKAKAITEEAETWIHQHYPG
jgi:1-acyl-sn-glycerol-3-phosphate acyltransferase